jgi:nicotinamidase-related amidase
MHSESPESTGSGAPLPNSYLRSHELLSRQDSRLVVVDVQEKFVPHIPQADQLIAKCRLLIQGAQLFGVPVSATEQYPQGLGPTVPELRSLLADVPAKLRFSCAEVLNLGPAAARGDDRFKIVLCGIETHVCIQQTALDFIAQGYQVYVPADAVASRHQVDWQFALQRLAASGATITTAESILFEWGEIAGTPEFKQLSQLVKGR